MKLLLTLSFILLMSVNIQANDKDQTKKQITQKAEKKKDAYPGVEWKPKTDLDKHRDKYPGVEWQPKEGKDKYPGVEWKPKNGDPKPHENTDAYPGVEWSPKK